MTTKREPIAIIGTACRLPGGVSNLDEYWSFLRDGKDAVDEIPTDRWDWRYHYDENDRVGRAWVKRGGFMDHNIENFDAAFFDISPREAQVLDPQQRLLLEVMYEALEDAVGDVTTLRGSDTGVYMGCFMQDNMLTQMGPSNKSAVGTYTAVSSTMTMISNRLSYTFDLQGPSFTLDTACSSSLVAVHQACRGLLAGDCRMAVSGGVNVMFRPETMMMMSKGRFLAKDGRSKTFSANADGYGRGEGAGLVVLKRLEDAIAAGDTIHGVIMSTGVNQDGNTDGITVPSEHQQTKLANHVYAEAGIDPRDITYLEAHGTGTPIGDPIEMRAMGGAVGQARLEGEAPLLVGSVKASIGHLEAAAGIAGLLKALLVCREGEVPPQGWMDTELNPDIDFEGLNIAIADKLQPLPKSANDRSMVAINSFGYGGTNAHAVVAPTPEGLPQPHKREKKDSSKKAERLALFISGGSDDALAEYAALYADMLENDKTDANTLCASASARTQLEHRAVVYADSAEDLLARLRIVAENERGEGIIKGRSRNAKKMALVFSGMGPQWWGMGQDLMASEPVFADALQAADKLFVEIAGWSILDEMMKPEHESNANATEVAQPANFMIQMGLFELLRSWGVAPQGMVGHSVGEVSSAWASGSLSLHDALTVSYHRSRTQAKTAGTGGMLATGLSQIDAEKLVAQYENKISVAGFNSATNCTLSGCEAILEQLAAELEEQGVLARKLKVEVPYHSAGMDPILDELRDALISVEPEEPNTPLYSTVTGEQVDSAMVDSQYWCDNVREPVYFQQAIKTMLDDGFELFLEVGPHPVLSGYVRETMLGEDNKGSCIQTLKRKENENHRLAETLSNLWVNGCTVDFSVYVGEADRDLKMPAYPWQRKKHWSENPYERMLRQGWPGHHPLLGRRLADPIPTFETELNEPVIQWLPHHKAGGNVVFPGAGYVDTLIAAHQVVAKSRSCVIRDVDFLRALIVDNVESPSLRTIIEDESSVRLYSGTPSKWDDWQLHASARLEQGSFSAPTENPLDAIDESTFDQTDVEELYQEFATIGLEYSGPFRSIKALCKQDNTAIVDLSVESDDGHHLHPALLDGAFQSMLALMDDDSDSAYLPVHIDELRLYSEEPITSARAILNITHKNARSLHANLTLISDGMVVAEVRGIRCDAAALSSDAEAAAVETMTYAPTWEEIGIEADIEPVERIALVGERDEELADILQELGCTAVDFHDSLATVATDQAVNEYAKIVTIVTTDSDQQALEQSVATVSALQSLSAAGCTAEVIMVTSKALTADIHGPLTGWHAGWLAGLRRNAHNELTTMNFRQVDKCDETDEVDLATEVLSPNAPDEVALKGGERYAMNYQPVDTNSYKDRVISRKTPFVDDGSNSFELIHQGRTNYEALTWLEIDRPQPGPREVQVRVESLALNFKDTAKVMGFLTEEMMSNTVAGMRLGHECAGIVSALGEDVSEYKIGDRVVVTKEDSFRHYICVNVETGENSCDFVRPVPEHISLAEASAATVVYGTALWGLRDHARLRAGDSILIHGAAGGAGMAALYLAKHYGATTIVTAGTEEKRAFLKAQGADHVLDSRSLNFAAQVRELTGGEGVNVVFNSVGGGVVPLSFDALADFGHFIEIGKTDIFSGNRLDMKPFNRSISYSALDLDFLTARRRAEAITILSDGWQLLIDGHVPTLPVNDFAADNVADAFSFLTRSQQIGKVTINLSGDVQTSKIQTRNTGLSPEKTVLITGGFGGVGLLVANWCIDNGAKTIALLGRSGDKSDSAKATVATLEARGVTVHPFACDAADRDALAKVISSLEAQGPLGSIIHAAGTLDDRPFAEMDEDAVRRVATPKICGANNLHELTADNKDIEFFLVFSSIATITGNTRQANYCLANSYMDSLVQHRLASGLPGNSINLGPVAEAGMAAGNDDTARYLELMGLFMNSNNQMQMLFDRIYRWNLSQVTAVNVDWAVWEYAEPRAAATYSFAHIIENFGSQNSNDSIISDLRRMNDIERQSTVSGILVEHISDILQMSTDEISLESGLDSFGIDSLTAVELQSMINRSLSIEISILSMLGGKTLQEVAAELVSLMKLDEQPEAPIALPTATTGDSNVKEDLELDATSANEGELDFPQVSQ